MGIFKEDLINFGNLIDTEVEVNLSPEDFRRVFPQLEFKFSDRLAKIRGKKNGFLFKKSFEFRGAQEEQKIYNVRKYETEDMGIYLKIISKDGADILAQYQGIELEREHLKLSVFETLKNSPIYKDIPEAFKDKLLITRYKIREGHLTIYITVTKV